MRIYYLILFAFSFQVVISQNTQNQIETLDSVVVNAQRIELPFSKNSRSIFIITNEQINKEAATSVAQLLQNVAGIDVRQRGVDGMQADLYIRGGSFDQTLLLIDGMAVADSQTGHHLLNSLPALENIERIEIIKGPAARIFGQNAFTGAINIITKLASENSLKIDATTGSYNHTSVGAQVNSITNNYAQVLQYKRNTSAGYRFNTDFKNDNAFYKSNFNIRKLPIQLLANYGSRKFGANGFYANPNYKDQYEETQTSLVGLSSQFRNKNYTLKSTVFWKRNQDMYLFLRENPTFFRNFHITNNVGATFNSTIKSQAGITGLGVAVSKNYIVSNNLGAHNRFIANVFIEHRFSFDDDKVDITPGVALNYFSDFNFHAFPGIDLGYALSPKMRLYGNLGYTYRIPTYTDLFYSDPATKGNENLKPESAFAQELGLKFNNDSFKVELALFNRNSHNLIDYVKYLPADKWQANNLFRVNSYGLELNSQINFRLFNYNQNLQLGYNYLKDNIKQNDIPFSRYSLNSIKHQVITTFNAKFFEHFFHSITTKFVERPNGTHYSVVDSRLNIEIQQVSLSLMANNIFNANYTETSLVPMPKANFLMRMAYTFK